MLRNAIIKLSSNFELLGSPHYFKSNVFFDAKNFISMKSFKPVNHVIFDMDGLLLDTEDIYSKVFQTIASQYGKSYTNEVREKVMGKVEREAVLGIIQELDLPLTVDAFLEQQYKLQPKYLPEAQMMPGAESLIRHLHKKTIPMAVATGSAKEGVDLKLTKHQELFSLFSHIVMGSTDPEVKRGKPYPDIFLVCASRFCDKPFPEKCLVFEDAPNGVKAAVAAGMQVVMVPQAIVQEENRKDATLVLSSLKDFDPQLFGLPPFEVCSCMEA